MGLGYGGGGGRWGYMILGRRNGERGWGVEEERRAGGSVELWWYGGGRGKVSGG